MRQVLGEVSNALVGPLPAAGRGRPPRCCPRGAGRKEAGPNPRRERESEEGAAQSPGTREP